jgi:hypothetical protein
MRSGSWCDTGKACPRAMNVMRMLRKKNRLIMVEHKEQVAGSEGGELTSQNKSYEYIVML